MATRKPLGRGLSALIPQAEEGAQAGRPAPGDSGVADEAVGAPLYVPIARIAANPEQPRKTFRQDEIASLAESIREQGVLQPLVVREVGDGYELVIGERRWRAAQQAGLSDVPCVVVDATDRVSLEMALVENVQRADLNPIEVAEAFRALVQNEGMTQEEVSRRVGVDRSSISNHLRILELPGVIQQDLIDARLSLGHAKAILQVPETQRVIIRDQVVRAHLSVRATEELCRRCAANDEKATSPAARKREVHLVHLEDQLRNALQTRVRIVGRKERGRIELHYHGTEQLDRLADLLMEETP